MNLKVLIYLAYIIHKKRTFLKFLSQESISEGSEGYIYIIKRMLNHQKDPKHFKRIICPKGFDQKDDLQKVDLHEVPHPQSLLSMIHGSFLKKLEMTKSKRSADNSEQLADANG